MQTMMAIVLISGFVGQIGSEELVKRHEEYLRSIRSLKCSIDQRVSFDGGKNWTVTKTFKLARSGEVERVHSVEYFRSLPGYKLERLIPIVHTDSMFDAKSLLSMQGYNPEHPPAEPVTALQQMVTRQKIGGAIRAAQQAGTFGYKGALSCDYLLLMLADDTRSLRELLDSNPNVKPTARKNEGGEEVWDLPLKSEDGRVLFEISLAPKHGYAITEIRRRPLRGNGGTGRAVVTEFCEPDRGIFLPKVYKTTIAGNPKYLRETIVRDAQVNSPISEVELSFRFPEGIEVADVQKNVYYLWGKGSPSRTLTTEELNRRREEEYAKARKTLRTMNPNHTWVFALIGISAVVIVFLAILRYRQRASASLLS